MLALLGLLVWDSRTVDRAGIAVKVDQGKIVPAPEFDAAAVDGSGRSSLASLRGKVVVVNFWQSYCVAVQAEARAVARRRALEWARDVVFLGVDAQDLRRPGDARS